MKATFSIIFGGFWREIWLFDKIFGLICPLMILIINLNLEYVRPLRHVNLEKYHQTTCISQKAILAISSFSKISFINFNTSYICEQLLNLSK